MGEVKIQHLGCPGHFIAVKACNFRRHTQIGDEYRISTVGDYFDSNGIRQTVGAGEDSFFETYVFRTSTGFPDDSDGCGCREVLDWCEIDGVRSATAGEANRIHDEMVAKYAALAEAS